MLETYFQTEEMMRGVVQEYSVRRNLWQEPEMTGALSIGLANGLNGTTIHYDNLSKRITWEVYRNTRRRGMEQQFGDLSILVLVQFSDGSRLEGVAFLESKRVYPSGVFEALHTPQLTTIRHSAPYAQLLLCDVHQHPSPNWAHSWVPPTNFHAMPVNTAIPLVDQHIKDRLLYRNCIPLAAQILTRFLWGLDLHFDRRLIAKVKEAMEDLPEYLNVVQVFYPDQRPLRTVIGSDWEPLR